MDMDKEKEIAVCEAIRHMQMGRMELCRDEMNAMGHIEIADAILAILLNGGKEK